MRYLLAIAVLLLCTEPAVALVIDRDTEWSGEKSFAEPVRVLPGATLTLAPGTRLIFADAGLDVAGNLVARKVEFSGEKWQGILLKGNDGKTKLTGCLIKGAKIGVQVQGGEPVLQKLTLVGNNVGVEFRGRAGGIINSSIFTGNEKVGLFLKDGSTTAVADCRFENNGRFGAYLYRANPRQFVANSFFGNEVALMVAYHGSDPAVSGNIFEQNDIAIQVDRSARPVIKQNLLRNNRTGIYAYRRSDPMITGNRLENNDVGVLVAYSSYPQIEGNDFNLNKLAIKLEYQSSQWEAERGAQARASEAAMRTAFAGQGKRTVNEEDRKVHNLDDVVSAKENWWGSAGLAELEAADFNGNPSFIHDGRDQTTFTDAGEEFPLDKVDYKTWRKTPLSGSLP